MLYYQLPNKLEWYKDIVYECARRNISMKVICKIAGISHQVLKYSARQLKNTGTGISYETLVNLTDALNGLEGSPEGGRETPDEEF